MASALTPVAGFSAVAPTTRVWAVTAANLRVVGYQAGRGGESGVNIFDIYNLIFLSGVIIDFERRQRYLLFANITSFKVIQWVWGIIVEYTQILLINFSKCIIEVSYIFAQNSIYALCKFLRFLHFSRS